MCGIAGVVYFDGHNPSSTIEKMLKEQKHRGPTTSQSISIKNIAIGSVRLSMRDVDNKDAIFFNEKRDIVVVYNGEIYNYLCLKNFLIKNGHSFATENDAEIIPHLYEMYGRNFVQYLDGMFAFCLIDMRSKFPKIILGRDHFGVKPLYYYKDASSFVFASEIKPILTIVPKQKLDEKAISSYLKYRFVANPLTPFKNIKKVKPSSIIIFREKLISRKYFPSTKYVHNYNNVFNILKKSVEQNTEADVKLGCFLSGGLDSSIISCLMTKFIKRIPSFTIQYENFLLNELEYANLVSQSYKNIISNYVCVNSKTDLVNVIEKIVLALEEPIYSTVTVATYLLSQQAKKQVSGVLTGDGSDELFMSYQYLKKSFASKIPLECYKKNIGWLSNNVKHFLFYDQNIFNKIKLLRETKNIINTFRDFELKYRLSDYHLLRVDKLTMANSIEARVPFLCTNLLYFTNKLDLKKILMSKNEKEELKRAFYKLLPKDICCRKKQPFSSPYQHWIDNELKSDIIQTFSNQKFCKIFKIRFENLLFLINKKDKNYFDYTAIWGIYILFKWLKRYEKYLFF